MKYRVTDAAGEWIAGVKSPGVGEIMELTPAQAEYELMRGVLVAIDERPVEKPLTVLPPYRKGKRR